MALERILAAALLIAVSPAAAEPLPLGIQGSTTVRQLWGHVVASPQNDWINDLVPLSNGNILGVGFLNRQDVSPPSDWSAVAVELGTDGERVAERRYGEGGGIDAFWSVMEGQGGRRMFAGFTTRIGQGGINGFVLVAEPNGTVVHERAFGGAGYDRFTDLTQAGEGYVFLGHSQLPNSDLRRVYLVRTDRDGVANWERTFGETESWGALYIEPSGDGGFIVSGGVSAPDADGDMFVVKVDSHGRELWRRRVGTPDWDEINHGLVVRPDQSIVLVGYTHPRGEETNDVVAATLTKNGEVIRLERFGGTGDERAISAKLDGGRIWIVGQTASAGAGGTDLLIASLGPDGSFDPGAVTMGGVGDDNGTAILPLPDGSLVVAGYTRNLGVGEQDAFIARLTQPTYSLPNPAFRRTVVTPVR